MTTLDELRALKSLEKKIEARLKYYEDHNWAELSNEFGGQFENYLGYVAALNWALSLFDKEHFSAEKGSKGAKA